MVVRSRFEPPTLGSRALKIIEHEGNAITKLRSTFNYKDLLNTTEGERKKMKYRVYRFDIKMTRDQGRLEQFLNSLEGEVVTIIPNVTPMPATYVDFLLIVEKREE